MESHLALLGRLLFLTALIGYAISALAYLAYILFPKNVPKALPTTILIIVSVLNIAIVILRSIESGRSPFSSRFESITFFGMTIGIIYLLTEWRLGTKFGGFFACLIAFGLFFYIVLFDLDRHNVPFTFANVLYLIKTGGTQMKSMPLAPALQSPWFFWHVSLAFLGYAFFTSGFVMEITGSCLSAGMSPNFNRNLKNAGIVFGVAFLLFLISLAVGAVALLVIAIFVMFVSGVIAIGMLLGKRYTSFIPFDEADIQRVGRFTYNQVLFAYPLLTWCVISGGAWADKAWGTYWSWDPKEIWSLITWLIYAGYFHLKGHPAWRKRPASVVNIIGFAAVMTTYLMVNYLVQWFDLFSLHAYA